jgi:two-component system cell cycle response regulator
MTVESSILEGGAECGSRSCLLGCLPARAEGVRGAHERDKGVLALTGEVCVTQSREEIPALRTVLLVDDNAQNLELLEVYMEDVPDARVITATNGLEAMGRVNEQSLDLILLDIMMPKMSGFEVCKRLKADPKTRDIVIVMVTALHETGDIERAAECGADDYISKPIDRKALVALVQNLLAAKARG